MKKMNLFLKFILFVAVCLIDRSLVFADYTVFISPQDAPRLCPKIFNLENTRLLEDKVDEFVEGFLPLYQGYKNLFSAIKNLPKQYPELFSAEQDRLINQYQTLPVASGSQARHKQIMSLISSFSVNSGDEWDYNGSPFFFEVGLRDNPGCDDCNLSTPDSVMHFLKFAYNPHANQYHASKVRDEGFDLEVSKTEILQIADGSLDFETLFAKNDLLHKLIVRVYKNTHLENDAQAQQLAEILMNGRPGESISALKSQFVINAIEANAKDPTYAACFQPPFSPCGPIAPESIIRDSTGLGATIRKIGKYFRTSGGSSWSGDM